MKTKMVVFGLMLGVGAWVTATQAADPKDKKPGQDAPGHEGHKHGEHEGHQHGEHGEMKLLQATPEHKVLHETVGKWKIEVKHWMPGQTEPETAYGTSKVTQILDGLGTVVEDETTGDEGTFKGYGLFTWNSLTKKYEGVWLDNHTQDGPTEMTGTYDAATKTLTWTYSGIMPGMGSLNFKMVEKRESKDKIVSTFFMLTPDKQEVRMMEITSTRTS